MRTNLKNLISALLLALGGLSLGPMCLAQPVAAAPTPSAQVTQPSGEVGVAPVALLVDLGSGRTLYAHNPDQPFLPASVTKTMTAYVAFELMAQGKLRPEQTTTAGSASPTKYSTSPRR